MISYYSELNNKQLAFLDAAIMAEMAFIRAERAMNLSYDDPKRKALRRESRAMRREFVAIIGHGLTSTVIHVMALQRVDAIAED